MSACALLSGCGLGPDFLLSEPRAEGWRANAGQAGPQAAVWPEGAWWRGFGSPELDALIMRARADNQNIAAAAARVRQADAQTRIAGAPLLPTASLAASDSWQRSSGARSNAGSFTGNRRYRETRTFTVQPSLSYEIDLWGRLAASRDNALATALANRFDQQTVVLTTETSVASTWFQALALQDRLDVSARNLRDAEQILAAIRARFAAGTASQLDVAQQEALVAGVRANVPGLRSQLEQQLNGLGILTGQPPAAITVRPGTLNALRLPEVAPGLPSEVLARRPDVAAAEADLVAANANIRVARANFLPVVELSGSAGWQSLALGTLFGPGSLFASAALNATQAVFDNGLRRAQFDQAQARYDELLANYRNAVLQAFTDVENAIQAYRFATEQEGLSREAVAVAQRAADIARAQLLAGTSDIITALQVQNTLFSNLDSLAQVRLSRFQALLSLYKALGGGWTRADVPPPQARRFQGVL